MGTTRNQIDQPATGVLAQSGQDADRIISSKTWRVVRWTVMLCILLAVLTIVRSLPLDQAMSVAQDWIAGLGVWGPVGLVLLYIVATVLFVPGTILTLVAGAMFGLAVGTVVVSIGSTVGASLAFLIARYGAREKVAELAKRNRHFGAMDRAIAEGGWKIVGMLRLSPAIPFNLQNYLYGLTPVRFWPYAVTSWIAMLPGTFLFVYIGHVTGAAVGSDRQRSMAEWIMLAVGLLATVVVTVYVTRLASQKLKEEVDESGADDGAGQVADT
ncbi:MAG: TVP38/TMEM64 family protein [Rhodopirellula sp. JB055]|uniref:TVP38/TMEM64 family protein n=1 Tax=Rhodopirellula sp. JB055 TaxID=3342846 RepID=UPI00370CB43C